LRWWVGGWAGVLRERHVDPLSLPLSGENETNSPVQTLTSDLHNLGYSNQISVDFSQVLINAMSLKYAALNTTWSVMDVRKLDIPDASVDLAIDKGTLDAFIHGSPWNPPEDVVQNVGSYVDEVRAVFPVELMYAMDGEGGLVGEVQLIDRQKMLIFMQCRLQGC
jgi:hypothetical protein